MHGYLFIGTVHPQRAVLSAKFSVSFDHLTSGRTLTADIDIKLNQVAVWASCQELWDEYDLRNVVETIVQNHLAAFSYLKGYVYSVEITRVICREAGLDHVFGVDIPCLSERHEEEKIATMFVATLEKMNGHSGMLLARCFRDLVRAMQEPDDTAFFCYRAIESLRKHCAQRFGIEDGDRNVAWTKLKEVAGLERDSLDLIVEAAKEVRHGGVSAITSGERELLFRKTWAIVDAYVLKD